LAGTALTFPALAQQGAPAPSSPPAAAQEPATFGEKAGRLLDRVTGNPAATADVDMRRVLDSLANLNPQAIEQLPPQEARQQPTPTDAVMALLKKEGKDPESLKAQMSVKTQDTTYPAAAGTQPARIYTPEGAAHAGEPLPVVVYFHGGGWVIADINTYDAGARAIAKEANTIVVSAEYRHAPEAKFPAAHDDAVAAYKWTLENAQGFGGDPTRVAVMGESAGGNLAINVAIAARDQNLQRPAAQVLVYPVAGVDMNTPSYKENEDAKPLNKAMMAWFMGHVTKSDQDKQDPRLDLIGVANLRDLPPTTIITAEIDPLRSDGQLLADKLKQAGVQTTYENYDGVTHEFFGMGAVVADAKSAQALAGQQLKQAFGSGTGQGGTNPALTGSTSTPGQR
jgi:acetyl esterase/lipase